MKCKCCGIPKDADDFRPYRNKWGQLRRRGNCRACETKKQIARDKENEAARRKGVTGTAWRNRYLVISTPDNSYPVNKPGYDVYFWRSELEDMLEAGDCLTPGTIVAQKDVRYKVTGNLRAWENFANADYPLDYEMPPQELRRL